MKTNLAEVKSPTYGFIPQQNVVGRITGAEAKKDKNGDPYVQLSTELVEPDNCTYTNKDGVEETVIIASRQANYFLFFNPKSIGRAKEFHKALGLPMEIDLENIDTKPYLGVAFHALITSKVDAKLDYNKQPIVDPLTNQPVVNVNINYSQIYGRADKYCVQAPF
jgi:hypothetical protein